MIDPRKLFRDHATPNRIRWMMNFYRPFRGANIKITHISDDWKQATVRMKLNIWNRNYVGTQFGGSLYSMADPLYMLMLFNILGKEYIVWDKSARIEFIKPGRGAVSADFHITDEDIATIKTATATGRKYLPTFTVDIKDEQGKLIAQVEKELYVRLKRDRAERAAKK